MRASDVADFPGWVDTLSDQADGFRINYERELALLSDAMRAVISEATAIPSSRSRASGELLALTQQVWLNLQSIRLLCGKQHHTPLRTSNVDVVSIEAIARTALEAALTVGWIFHRPSDEERAFLLACWRLAGEKSSLSWSWLGTDAEIVVGEEAERIESEINELTGRNEFKSLSAKQRKKLRRGEPPFPKRAEMAESLGLSPRFITDGFRYLSEATHVSYRTVEAAAHNDDSVSISSDQEPSLVGVALATIAVAAALALKVLIATAPDHEWPLSDRQVDRIGRWLNVGTHFGNEP